MMHALSQRPGRLVWWRILLFVATAFALAATFMAYFSPNGLVDFANMRLC